jgi:two-component system, LytTR family, sensor histidine kinase AlgZ
MLAFFQRNRVIILHLSFWGVYLSFFVYQITSFRRQVELSEAFAHAGFHVGFNMITAYVNYFIFLPRFLERKKIGRYLLEFSLPFALLMFARVHLQRWYIDGYSHKVDFFYSNIFVVQATATTLFTVIFVGMLRFAKEWFEFEARKKEIENEKLTAELTFLKAQINPHFLFNTLNNLYYLAYSKSEHTTEIIAKLSQMMRYMIYDSNHAKVLLGREIEYMQNYISLERLRLNDQIPIRFEVEGKVDDVWITPLVFITFLENAFKHGVTNTSTRSWVNVSIRVHDGVCIYTVENSKIVNAREDNGGRSGIGLRNVARRLELSYPGKYSLQVNDQADRYAVQLNLTLS